MDADKIAQNVDALIAEIQRKKPSDASMDYIRTISISSSMGPGVWIKSKDEE